MHIIKVLFSMSLLLLSACGMASTTDDKSPRVLKVKHFNSAFVHSDLNARPLIQATATVAPVKNDWGKQEYRLFSTTEDDGRGIYCEEIPAWVKELYETGSDGKQSLYLVFQGRIEPFGANYKTGPQSPWAEVKRLRVMRWYWGGQNPGEKGKGDE